MRIFHLLHPSVTYLTTTLVILTGCFFATLCLFMLLIEFSMKLVLMPIIFLIGMGSLAYGLVNRKLFKAQ